MKVFLAGGTGAVGRQLVPELVERGHTVVATTRSPDKIGALRALGAEGVVMDGLDPASVRRAVIAAAPDVVVHQMTSLSGARDLRRFDDAFEYSNRLRTEGTDSLLAAAREAGAGRFVAQSFTGWPNERRGGPVKSEEDPLDPDPPRSMRRTLAAIRHVEETVGGIREPEGIVLRYGFFYGPGTAVSAGGEIPEAVRRRRLPLVGGGRGVWSFVHVDDVAWATARAVEGAPPGLYNVVDDEPAEVRVWLPELARILGAPPPRRVPAWLARPLAGEAMVAMMTAARGSSNAKAKRVLGWTPLHPSWREGFRELAGEPPPAAG